MCDERLKANAQGSSRLAYTGLRGGLEHLKIETRLRGERFQNHGEGCVCDHIRRGSCMHENACNTGVFAIMQSPVRYAATFHVRMYNFIVAGARSLNEQDLRDNI